MKHPVATRKNDVGDLTNSFYLPYKKGRAVRIFWCDPCAVIDNKFVFAVISRECGLFVSLCSREANEAGRDSRN